MYKDVAQ